jgi:hypothetical protein
VQVNAKIKNLVYLKNKYLLIIWETSIKYNYLKFHNQILNNKVNIKAQKVLKKFNIQDHHPILLATNQLSIILVLAIYLKKI